MKKVGMFLFVVLFLSGCSGEPKEVEQGMELRSKILKGTSCSFDVEITADFEDRLCTFSMGCIGDTQGDLKFTVTGPESIKGITGEIADAGGKLTFDKTALDFGLLADGQVAPITAPWIFLKALRSGYLTSAGKEGELLRLSIDDSFREDALQVDIWLNGENIPIHAEILWDGLQILSLKVTNFTVV